MKNPNRRLILGAWNHGGSHNCTLTVQSPTQFNHFAEWIRFFDTYVKGIETRLQEEPPIHYYTMVAEKWKSAESWPPPAQSRTLYFHADNQLTPAAPSESAAADSYQVDYQTGTGNTARWNSLNGAGVVTYADRSAIQPALLTYTSSPLEADTEVTGHPLVWLFFASSTTDAQVYIYLEDVTPDGQVHLITEGQLRASHRKVSAAPYQTPVPYRSFTRVDAQPLIPNQTVELVIDLLPTSYLFQRGHCLRISIAGADKDHFEIPDIPPPLLTIQRNRQHASAIVLPVI
jgi:hypothetical protein